jgi:Uma2 family endonuclease
MALRMPDRMDFETYVAWEKARDVKHELVDGQPMMMVGSTLRHDSVKGNLDFALRRKLSGDKCRPRTSDVKVVIPNGNVRYPDLTIDCGRGDPTDLVAAEPTVVFEVLSPGSMANDFVRKLRDYQLIPSLKAYVILWQDAARAIVHTRRDGAWLPGDEIEGLDGVLVLPVETSGGPLTVTMTDIYDGVDGLEDIPPRVSQATD